MHEAMFAIVLLKISIKFIFHAINKKRFYQKYDNFIFETLMKSYSS